MKFYSRLLILIGLLCLCVMPLVAQDASEIAYAEALRRIEEARVSGATDLGLIHIGLTEVPPEIGQLINLESLIITYNNLRTLPPEIGLLSNLEYLSLNNNQLASLPPEIGQLTNLRILNVDNNQLTALPSDLEQLEQLYVLLVSGNPVTFVLPPLEEGYKRRSFGTQMRDHRMRQIIIAIAPGVGGIAMFILAFRWRQRRAWGEKKKRM